MIFLPDIGLWLRPFEALEGNLQPWNEKKKMKTKTGWEASSNRTMTVSLNFHILARPP